jgi:TolA-binding protein
MSTGTPASPETRSQTDVLASLGLCLEALSNIGESLTFRLLELEQRFEAVEEKISQFAAAHSAAEMQSKTLSTLECTERRIARLEDLLSNPSPAQMVQSEAIGELAHDEECFEENPFPDEVEEPFMDELAA